MTLIDGLKADLEKNDLSEEYSIHNSKGIIESILDHAFVVDLEKAIIKNDKGKIVCKAQLSHGFLRINPLIPQLEFLRFKGWII